MNKKLLLMTTLAAAIAAGTIPAATAAAAQAALTQPETPSYPSSFVQQLDMSEDGLTDYAVNGDTYAFAVKTTIYIISTGADGDRALSEFTYGTQITALDYDEGKLYFKSTSESAYSYPDVTTPVAHTFPEEQNRMVVGKDWYILSTATQALSHIAEDGVSTNFGEGYSKLKRYGENVYAVKDNVPYKFEGINSEPLDLQYTDFSAADNISTGNIAAKLKANDYAVKTATLKDGSYYTQINTDGIGEKFTQIRTFKADGAVSCIVLAEDGGVSVIAAGGNCYVTANESLTINAYSPPVNDWAQGPNGRRKAYLRERTGVYSSPYMCQATRITGVNAGEAIAVTVQEKFALDFIDTVFYRISYTASDNTTVTGFVAAGYLDEYDYSADVLPPSESDKSDFGYDTNVTTVILILVIVGLVIIAIVYLTVIGTKQDKKGKNKKKKKTEKEED